MLSLYGYEYAIKNVYLAARSALGERQVNNLDQLRCFYLDALTKLAPKLPINRSQSRIIVDLAVEERLTAFFSTSVLDDLRQDQAIGPAYPPETKQAKLDRVSEAWDALTGRSIEFARTLNLIVHSVFVRSAVGAGKRTPRAGTTSLAPGVIWLAVHDNESVEDLIEILIHELTHLLMFTDELIHPQFDYTDIAKRDTFTLSALLGAVRPLDKVVHSMVVGTEIIMGRSALRPVSHCGTGAHPDSRVIAAGVSSAYLQLVEHPLAVDSLTQHTQEIIARCHGVCGAYNLEPATL